MKKLMLIFSLLISSCQYLAKDKDQQLEVAQNSIVGGEVVSKNSHQEVVAFIRDGDFHCTGVLIAPTIVLTAAHCLVDVSVPELSVYVGNGYDKPSDKTFVRGKYKISKMLIHPNLEYVEGLGLRNLGDYNANDVGIVFLETQINNVKPSKLLTNLSQLKEVLYSKSMTTVVGFGYTSEDGDSDTSFKKPDYGLKRQVDISIKEFDNHEVDIRDEGRDSCYIDSGGPVFVDRDGESVVLALVSGSNGFCAENQFPVYYSMVFDSICWIAQETGLEFEGLEENCNRSSIIASKCGELSGDLAKECARDLSAFIFEEIN